MDDAEISRAVAEVKEILPGVDYGTAKYLNVLITLAETLLSVKGVEKIEMDFYGESTLPYNQTCIDVGWNKAIDATRLWIAKRLPDIEELEVIINRYSPMENFEIKEQCATAISELIRERLNNE